MLQMQQDNKTERKIEDGSNKTEQKNKEARREEWMKIEEVEINSCRCSSWLLKPVLVHFKI
jgi:hypothetical protein